MNDHTLAIKIERKLMRDTGLTREQLRSTVLGGPVQDMVRQIRKKETEEKVKESKAVPEVAPVETVTQSFERKPFILGGEIAGNGQNGIDGVSSGGTSVSPYVMGANRTTTDPTAADDTWDITAPPAGTDGVSLGNPIRSVLISTTVTGLDPGKVHTNYMYSIFRRPLIFDSVGRLIYIGVETAEVVVSQISIA